MIATSARFWQHRRYIHLVPCASASSTNRKMLLLCTPQLDITAHGPHYMHSCAFSVLMLNICRGCDAVVQPCAQQRLK